MSALTIEDLHVAFGPTSVLDGVDLTVEAGDLTAVLGPSGCGKTTLLRAVAGFVAPQRGRILSADRVLTDHRGIDQTRGPVVDVPAEHRGIGLVPQEGALFGHLDVAGNVGFGLPRGERRAGVRVAELLDLVGLSGFERRRPHELSGGQQQRVALARALAPRPRLVLLDEPFSALDAGLRETLRDDVREVLHRAGATAVLVTHDQDEALSMADSVAVMQDGRILMHDGPQQVYDHPTHLSVARFVGQLVELEAELDDGWARTVLGQVPVEAVCADAPSERTTGRGLLVLRPEQLVLQPGNSQEGVAGRVLHSTYYGHDATHAVQLQTTGPQRAAGPVVVLARSAGQAAPDPLVRVVVHGAGRFFRT